MKLYEYDGGTTFSGWVEFAFDDIKLLSLMDSSVCFYMYFCVDGSPCVAVGCVPASDIFNMIPRRAPMPQPKGRDVGMNTTIKLFPNHTTDMVKIEAGADEIVSLEVYDVYGRQQKSVGYNTYISLGKLPAGVYIIKAILDGGLVDYYKIIKK